METTTSVLEKKFKRMSSKELTQKLSKVTSLQEKEVIESILKNRDVPGTYRDPKFEEESKEIVKKIAEQQSKQSTTSSVTVNKGLTDEDSKKITQILESLPTGVSKKETIIALFDVGFTKQQLSKYRPSLASPEYIYELANQLKK